MADNQTINQWEQPVTEQARVNPRPKKRQSERSMKFEAKYGEYVFPERIIRLEREAAARERSQAAKEARATIKGLQSDVIVFTGEKRGPSKAQLAAERKARKEELAQEERAEAIARLGIPNARPFKSEKQRIGRAK